MAGVSILQPQDVLKYHVSYRRNSTCNPLPNPNPKNKRRKRSPEKNGSAKFSTVKILKRGQVLKVVKENKGEDLVLSTTDTVLKHTRIAEFYAGWGFSSSPPPSSLPVPAFFKKKSEDNLDATSDLRRLLRLDLAD
ncbi:uncharacterized protein [Solanum tuberosum]|uniref:Uncharacterized protein n=1 Tax=Solanum tuberosum TaxID=4113 RepID=M1B1X3_SOLTU|nr:PREDICTED: uncharacterized protein LOC102585406 [Solanum tuberosum]